MPLQTRHSVRLVAVERTLIAGIAIAAVVSAVMTIAFVLIARLLWRRGKSLGEP